MSCLLPACSAHVMCSAMGATDSNFGLVADRNWPNLTPVITDDRAHATWPISCTALWPGCCSNCATSGLVVKH